MGYVYIAKLYVMPNTYITKIGATTNPKQRMSNLGRNLKICCISKPHYNFFENEGILHEFYEKYCIPASPNSFDKRNRPELFFLSPVEIFNTMPKLNFETNLNNCVAHRYAKGKAKFYTSKKSVYRPDKQPKHS